MLRNEGLISVSIRDFSGGLNLTDDPDKIQNNEVQDCLNMLFDDKEGVVIPRPGKVTLSTVTGDVPVLRSYLYQKSNGTRYCIVQLSNFKIYHSVDRVSWTEIVPPKGSSGNQVFSALCDFETFEDMCWMSNRSDFPVIFDGTNAWVLNGDTYTGANYPTGKSNPWVTPAVPKGEIIKLTPDGNRLAIGNTANNSSEIRLSSYYDDDGNDIYAYDSAAWPALNQLAIFQDDGTKLKAIAKFQGNMICIKERSLNIVRGTNIDYYTIDRISSEVGTMSPWTVKEYKNALFFLGHDGIYAYNGATVNKVSDKMQPIFDYIRQGTVVKDTWSLTRTSDFDDGTPHDSVIDVSGDELKILPQDTDEDWNAGTLDNVTVADDSVTIHTDDDTDHVPGIVPACKTNTTPGITTSYWRTYISIASDNAWIAFDLGSAKHIYKASYTIHTSWGGTHQDTIIGAKVQYSTDNSNWYDAATFPNMTAWDTATYTLTFNTVNARYWRIYFPQNATSGQNYFATFDYIKLYSAYHLTGNIITRTLDFGYAHTSSPNFLVDVDTPENTSVSFKSRVSSDGITWDEWEDRTNGEAISTLSKRYAQLQVIMNSLIGTSTPTLHSIYYGSSWRSAAKNIGSVPSSWGLFEADYDANGQIATFWMRSATTEGGLAAASWVEQTPGTAIASVDLKQWIQVEVRFNTDDADEIPVVYAIAINSYTGGAAIQDACAVIYKGRYLLSCTSQNGSYNDLVIPMSMARLNANKGFVFSVFSGWNFGSMLVMGNDLFAGSSTDGDFFQAWTGKNDSEVAIDQRFTCKDFDFKYGDNQKLMRFLVVNMDQPSDATHEIAWSFDAQEETVISETVTRGGPLNKRHSLTAGAKGKLFRVEFRNDTLNEEMHVRGFEAYYRILGLRNLP